MRRYQRNIIVLLIGFWVSMCFAGAIDIRESLRAMKFVDVEASLQATEAAFQQGSLSEYDFLEAYKVFYEHDDVLANEMAAWVHDRPSSYIAYLARGTYRRKLGEFRRGEAYINKVPPENVQYMQRQFALAKTDLQKALSLKHNSFIALLNLMNIAMYEDDGQVARQILDAANKAYPNNLLIRARYLVHLEPRWGGTQEQMETFISDNRKAGVPLAIVDLLSAIIFEDKGKISEEAGDTTSAKRNYERAIALSRSADSRFKSSYLSRAEYWCGRTAGCQR